jgi:hypothetical protein
MATAIFNVATEAILKLDVYGKKIPFIYIFYQYLDNVATAKSQ